MTGEIIEVGVPMVFRFSVGQVIDVESAARARVVDEINYATGRMYVVPYYGRAPMSWLRRAWERVVTFVRYGE